MQLNRSAVLAPTIVGRVPRQQVQLIAGESQRRLELAVEAVVHADSLGIFWADVHGAIRLRLRSSIIRVMARMRRLVPHGAPLLIDCVRAALRGRESRRR